MPESQEMPDDAHKETQVKMKFTDRVKAFMSRFWKKAKVAGVLPKDQYESFSVILGRDLIFMDWTIQFGGQLLGILVGAIVSLLIGANIFRDLFGGSDSINPNSFISLYVGTLIAVVGLSVYYIMKLGIRINTPKKIAKNKLNTTKIAFFGLSFVFGLSYLYNTFLEPAVNKVAGIVNPLDPNGNGSPPDNGGGVDWQSTDQYIILIFSIVAASAAFALLYSGIMYSINKKAKTLDGVAILTASMLLMFYLLSQFSMPQYLIEAVETKSFTLLLPLLNDIFYYSLIALVTLLVYHLSRRIELSIIILFLGFIFGYETTNIVEFLIILKWDFPEKSYISANLIKTLQGLQYAGLIGMIAYPLVFYRDTAAFFKKAYVTIRNQGVVLLGFFAVILVIEVILQFIFTYLGILFSLIIFIVMVGLVNTLITKRYGKQSFTGLMSTMTQATLQMSESVIPTLKKQTMFLEEKSTRKRYTAIILGTTIPLALYFGIMYLTTAVTGSTPVGATVFLYTALPISIGFIAFSLSYFWVKNPIIRSNFNYQYPLKVVGLIGGIIYFFYAINGLVYNDVGVYPLIALFYIPFLLIPIFRKDKLGTLLLSLAGDNKDAALKELLLRRDLDISSLDENFYKSPPYLRIWLALILAKKGEKTEFNQNLLSMLTSNFPLERATGALCILYLNDKVTMEKVIKILENDSDPRVRDAIAYGIRYFDELPEEIYKRIIDSQHYEDDAKVLETLKDTISSLDLRFSAEEQEEEVELEEYFEEI
jgi:hypothetical protein